ncbi:MAG: preprotein translocase subunit SecE [Acutalibacteraceae bacterium]|nr:preprotein translocase subunit SecE [Acutalibacteraceae bacterium]
MKTLNKICQVLAIVLGLASLVLFFTDFAAIITDGATEKLVGAQLAFGSKYTTAAGTAYDMAKSAQILFCFWLTAIAAVMSIFSFKSKKLRYAVPGLGVVSAVYMLVMRLSSAGKFVDSRPMANVTSVSYTAFVWMLVIALFLFVIASAAYLLIDDYIEVAASKGEKLTIPKRIIRFFKDYKSEVKKIVWPGLKEVIKNTVIVLIMCLLVGVLIWLIDFGLGQLLNLVLGA